MSYRDNADGGASSLDMRTQLFGLAHPRPKRQAPPRAALPYDPVAPVLARHAELSLLSLESQNTLEMDSMGQKVALLKNMGVKMGTEINRSLHLNDEITNSFGKGQVALKNTFSSMVRMSERAGISLKMWFFLFSIVGFCFFIVWLM